MKLFYKIYFWLFILVSLDILFHDFSDFHFSFSDAVSIFFTLTCPACLFLYAYNKKWLSSYFWKTFTLIYLASQIFYFYKHISARENPTEILIALILFLPLYIAMVRYSFLEKTKA